MLYRILNNILSTRILNENTHYQRHLGPGSALTLPWPNPALAQLLRVRARKNGLALALPCPWTVYEDCKCRFAFGIDRWWGLQVGSGITVWSSINSRGETMTILGGGIGN